MDAGKTLRITTLSGSGLVLSVLFLLLFYSFQSPDETPQCATKPQPFFCGTKNIPDYALSGKEVFNTNCAACHRFNTTDNILNLKGPLADSLYFQTFVTRQDFLKKHNIRLKKLYGRKNFYLHSFDFTPEETASLFSYIAYFEQN